MNLKVLLPFKIFAEKTGVSRIVAETPDGSFGLLPHRLDCVAALAPGILIYESETDGEVFVAVDEGVLVAAPGDISALECRDLLIGICLFHGEIENSVLKGWSKQKAPGNGARKQESRLGRLAAESYKLKDHIARRLAARRG